MTQERGPSNPEKETIERRFRVHYEVNHGDYCQRIEHEDVYGANEEKALRRFFSERLDYGSGVFSEAIEEVEMTLAGGKSREPIALPPDEDGKQNDRTLDLVVTAALSARFIRPPGGPAPVIRWWEGGREFLISFQDIEDVTSKKPCPTCSGTGEVEWTLFRMSEREPIEVPPRANLRNLESCPRCGSVRFYMDCPEVNTYLWDAKEQEWVDGPGEYESVPTGGPAFIRCADLNCAWSDNREYAPEPYTE